jgi:hypothetical protein
LHPTIDEPVLVNRENHHFAICKQVELSEVPYSVGKDAH